MTTGNRDSFSPLYRVLEDTSEVSAYGAMFDLCSMSIMLPQITGTEGQTLNKLSALSRVCLGPPGAGSRRLFIERNLERWRAWHSLVVCGDKVGEKMVFPHPTFSGQLTISRDKVPARDATSLTTWNLLFKVGVSVNRAVQAQTLTMHRRTKRVTRAGSYSLALTAVNGRQVTERLLVPASNIIDRTEIRQLYASKKTAEEHLREFIMELSQFCVDALGHKVSFVPTVTFGTLEVCWDFYDEQPIITVELMKEKAMRIAKSLRSRYAPSSTMSEGLNLNSPSVMIELIEDLSVRFYAKSTETVRFEVVYGADRIKAFKPHKGILTLEQAVQTARAVRLDAAKHMNLILSLMRQESEGCENDATTDELIRAVMAVFPDVVDARNILSLLASYRRIRTFPNDPRLAGLRKLKKLAVLENDHASPGKRNYVVTRRFEGARSMLLFTKIMPLGFRIKRRLHRIRRQKK